MAQPYIGQILLFAGNFAPANYAPCDGRSLAIAENDTLFNLIGTTYGGDGVSTFNLPDFRSRAPISVGTGAGLPTYSLGQNGGVEQVTLTTSQLPTHTHPAATTATTGLLASPSGAIFADQGGGLSLGAYAPGTSAQQPLASTSFSFTGGNLPHENRQPFLAIMICIALYGVYPSPS